MTKKLNSNRTTQDIRLPTTVSQAHATRETIESIVIAFVLAFLFRTFEAEAFVIPTGSMAPTLMGRHKDVTCEKCGYHYQVSASEEVEQADEIRAEVRAKEYQIDQIRKHPDDIGNSAQAHFAVSRLQKDIEILERSLPNLDIVGGVCPVCRYAMPMAQRNPPTEGNPRIAGAPTERSYNGDRILVNKYVFNFRDPKRWEVVVFHFPGNAEQNYIKRLVGLPGETLRIYQGNLHIAKPSDDGGELAFEIAHKPAETVLAMRQIVHDTDYDPAELFQAGWPLRWKADSDAADDWQVATRLNDDNVDQIYSVDRSAGGEAWLRYFHTVPNEHAWRIADQWRDSGNTATPAVFPPTVLRPELITDFCAYNTRVLRSEARANQSIWPRDANKYGANWVSDIMVEADVDVAEPKGELLLSLVKAGKHFMARVDLATGQARLEIDGLTDFSPQGATPLSTAGAYHIAFANVDDQLLLWVDDDLIQFDASTEYDALQVFGDSKLRPQTSGDEDPDKLDLSPVAIGANGSKFSVSRLRVWRDVYYIADSWAFRGPGSGQISDFDRVTDSMAAQARFDPNHWDVYLQRRHADFPLAAGQFFVMGDNSAASSDARLWMDSPFRGGQPSGAYLERGLLIGKAICVYWPHAAYSVFGVPIVPNFGDMRLVR